MTAPQLEPTKTGDLAASDAIVKLLSQPQSYPELTRSIDRIETHISWLFLTDYFVYKLKKPVKYDFLDFSTPQRRRWACEQEVRFNRRLAKGVYVGVVPITSTNDNHLQLGKPGNPVDWVVQMRSVRHGKNNAGPAAVRTIANRFTRNRQGPARPVR